jgi:hypothetical protein
VVTFDDDPVAHVRTEFGFDVTQYAWERYASRAYRKHIGFRVARPLLYLAFRETYGLHAGGILGPARSALASYRWSVRTLLPAFLHAESILLRRRLPTENQGPIRGQFLAALSRADHARYWNASYEGPGVGAHFMAILIRIIPKFGKLKILAVKPPDTSTEDLYLGSMNDAIGRFREYLSRLSQDPNAVLQLTNLDLDTGAVVSPGASETADATYAELLFSLAHEPSPAPDGIRRDVLAYYADLSSPIHTRNDPKKWRKLLIDLEALRRSGG